MLYWPILCIINITVVTRIILMANGKKPNIVDTLKKPTVPETLKETPKKSAVDQNLSAKESTKASHPEKNSNADKLQNKKVEQPLTAIEKYAKALINNNEPQTDPHPTATLSRFGLKTSKDVITFIRSPAGKSILTEISDKIAHEKAIQQDRQIKAYEHKVLMHRLAAAFFLWYLHKKAHSKALVRDAIEEQNKKAIENAKPHDTKSSKSLSQPNKEIAKALFDYESALLENMAQNKNIHEEGKALAALLNKYLAQEQMHRFQYEVYDAALERSDAHLDKYEKAFQDKDEKSLQEVQDHIQNIHDQLHQLTDQVHELLANGQEEEARKLMKIQTGLNIELANHHDMEAVCKGEKCYTDKQGNIVDSHKDAHFVLPMQKIPVMDEAGKPIPEQFKLVPLKIVEHDNKHHLLEPGEDWENVNKEKAQEKFEKHKHSLGVVKNVVVHNKTMDAKETTKQIQDVSEKIAVNKADEILAANQKVILQAGLASVQLMMNQPELNVGQAPRPMPMQTVTGNSHTPKPSISPGQVGAATLFFKKEIEKIVKDGTLKDLLTIAQDAPGTNKQADLAFLKDQYVKLNLQNKPIPAETMKELLKNLPSIAGAPKHPTATTTKNQEPSPTAPSPFLTKMTPFN